MGIKVKNGDFNPAASDGCTVISWVFRYLTTAKDVPFKGCCIEHDRVYWYGGDPKLREEADRRMRTCVKAHGYPVLAWIMWTFVHFFSGPKFLGFDNPFPWSWEKNVTIIRTED